MLLVLEPFFEKHCFRIKQNQMKLTVNVFKFQDGRTMCACGKNFYNFLFSLTFSFLYHFAPKLPHISMETESPFNWNHDSLRDMSIFLI